MKMRRLSLAGTAVLALVPVRVRGRGRRWIERRRGAISRGRFQVFGVGYRVGPRGDQHG